MATTLLWSNSTANDCYLVTFPNLETSTPISVKSCSYLVITDLYDSEVYRDEFVETGAAGIANEEIMLGASGSSNPGYLTQVQEDATNPKYLTPTSNYSGSDPFMHIPPRPLKRSRTMLFFWDGTFDTSNVVGSCWMDEFKELATSKVAEL